jgi:hypothetical protein
MDSKRLDELLAKYWNCQTTLEEEQELRRYLTENDVPDDVMPVASLFRYFEQQGKMAVQNDFDRTVMQKVVQANRARSGKLKALVSYSLRIAAGVAVLVAAIVLVRQELRKSDSVAVNGELVDTFDDPKEAFKETKRALEMISKGFGRAEQQAKKINTFNEAQEKIQRQLNKNKEL